jgi:hypothetical protein
MIEFGRLDILIAVAGILLSLISLAASLWVGFYHTRERRFDADLLSRSFSALTEALVASREMAGAARPRRMKKHLGNERRSR